MDARSPRTTRVLAACGVAGPAMFALVVAVLGALTPDYDHLRMPMSMLGARGAPHALAMNLLGFGLLGGLVMAFGAGLWRRFPGARERAAAALVVLGGLALLAVAALPCEPGCSEGPAQIGHSAAAGAMGLALGAALWVWALALRAEPGWRRHARLTLACAVLVTAFGGLLASEALPDLWGAVQRASVAPGLLWMAATGWRIARA